MQLDNSLQIRREKLNREHHLAGSIGRETISTRVTQMCSRHKAIEPDDQCQILNWYNFIFL
jgi:hypothetical protein